MEDVLRKCVHPFLISLLFCNYRYMEAHQIIRSWAAFCGKHQNRDFAWDVERNYTLAEIKHVADVLFQFLRSSVRLCYILGDLCSLVLCTNEEESSENGTGRPAGSQLWGFLTGGGCWMCPTAPSSWLCAIFVSITHVSLKAICLFW